MPDYSKSIGIIKREIRDLKKQHKLAMKNALLNTPGDYASIAERISENIREKQEMIKRLKGKRKELFTEAKHQRASDEAKALKNGINRF
jgi:SMC interacting uncharacterized protein involved in chromosome segregation